MFFLISLTCQRYIFWNSKLYKWNFKDIGLFGLSYVERISSLERKFSIVISHLPLIGWKPFIEKDFEGEGCLVTDDFHLSPITGKEACRRICFVGLICLKKFSLVFLSFIPIRTYWRWCYYMDGLIPRFFVTLGASKQFQMLIQSRLYMHFW